VDFPEKQRMKERGSMLRHTYIALLVYFWERDVPKDLLTAKTYINIVDGNKDVKLLESAECHRGLLHYSSPFTRWSEWLTVAFQNPITFLCLNMLVCCPSEAGFL